MGQELCECFIVQEIRAMGMDTHTFVRLAVVKNLMNISNNVSIGYFENNIFPLYLQLSQDKEEKVRKTCADVVAEIAKVSPLDRLAGKLQQIYINYTQDPTSKLVRGTAFSNIGPFIAAFKGTCTIDERITTNFITLTEQPNNKDVCYYAAFNFPAFIYVQGKADWPKFRKLF